jgi:hypothetical protein
MKKLEAKLGEKPAFPPQVFLPLLFYFFFLLCHRDTTITVATTTSSNNFHPSQQ